MIYPTTFVSNNLDQETKFTDTAKLRKALFDLRQSYLVLKRDQQYSLAEHPSSSNLDSEVEFVSFLPAINPNQLGDSEFCRAHNVNAAYVAGAMANGIGSAEICIAMGKAGMLGFFGAGGLHPRKVKEAIHRIQSELGDRPYGFNLLHNPFEPSIEEATVDMYLEHGITRVSASAYLGLTSYLLHYRLKGLHRNENGKVVAKNHIFAKLSRSEVARQFMAPAPLNMVNELLKLGKITAEEAELSQFVPVAEDITAEADSGGHTDNRPLVTLLPTFINLRDVAMEKYGFSNRIRVGASGGISTPQSVQAAFSMGASYVMTGSINQAATEAGTSDFVKEALTKVEPHDVIMAPAADMFEMGVKLQVLKKGSMFAMRAQKLYNLYQAYAHIDEIPQAERIKIEKQVFQKTLAEVWDETESFFQDRDPSQLVKAAKDPKHKMALIFRWYLGKSSLWAISGEPSRKMDYQVWAGPAQGAYNEWVRGTEFEEAKNRSVVSIAHKLLSGAAILIRLQTLKQAGVSLAPELESIKPGEGMECWL
ncbi:MAG: PfaD family polyunsaturated fatty acid/polyketide biosynthesis protein [bacterium]|nr:PfaD family polyunsaturated fatty acid/polyketide biosynthesis protein [bacterium]